MRTLLNWVYVIECDLLYMHMYDFQTEADSGHVR